MVGDLQGDSAERDKLGRYKPGALFLIASLLLRKVGPTNELAEAHKTSPSNHEGMAQCACCVVTRNGNEERRGETSGP